MESNIQSSFIPHDAGKPAKLSRRSEGGLADLALMLGIVAFAASAALAVGVFLYQQYLYSVRASDLTQLKRARDQFQPDLIQQLTRLDDRMQVADVVLGAHVAPSAFFNALNQVTAQTVFFSNLDMKTTDPHKVAIEMSGIGESVNSIAFQANLMSKSGLFSNPIFSNLDRQKDGVHFDLDVVVDPSKINFVTLTGGQIVPQNASPETAVPPPASPFGGAAEEVSPQEPQP